MATPWVFKNLLICQACAQPVLIVPGEDDRMVPSSHSVDLKLAFLQCGHNTDEPVEAIQENFPVFL